MLGLKLLLKLAADNALAEEKDADILVSEVKGRMDGANGDVGILGVDDAGDRTRAFALGDGEDRNTDRSEGSEESSCDVFFGRHAFADKREQSDRGHDLEGFGFLAEAFGAEFGFEDTDGIGEAFVWEDDSDGLAVGGLCGHPEGDISLAESLEDTLAHVGLFGEFAPSDIDQCEVFERSDAGGSVVEVFALAVDPSAVIFGRFDISDTHRDIGFKQREHGAWVENARAIMRQFEGFEIAELLDRISVGDDGGIGSHDAREAGPTLDTFGFEEVGKQGGGVIGAIAPKRRDASVFGLADESCVNGDLVSPLLREIAQSLAADRIVDLGSTEVIVGDKPCASVDIGGVKAFSSKQESE